MCPKPTPQSLAEHFDVSLRYLRGKPLPPEAPRPQPTALWPKENIALYERYRNWLLSGGMSTATTKTIYLPVAGIILGLNLKPHHQINLEEDLEKMMAYYRARDMKVDWLKSCRNGLNLFRRFLRLERGLGDEVRVRSFDASVYTRGLPIWLVSELERYQHIQQRNWRASRFHQNLHNFWNKLGLVWRYLCLERGIQQLADLKRQHILDYIDHRLDQKYSVATINAELRMLHCFLLFLQDEGYAIPQVVMRVPNLKQPDCLPKYLTDEQVKKLCEQAEQNVRKARLPSRRRLALLVRAAFYLLWQGGLRLAEVEELCMDDLDFPARCLAVRNSKNLKDRTVYLTDTVIQALKEYLDVRGVGNGSDAVFLYRNAPLKRSLIQSQLKTLGDMAGVHVYCHRLRHTCATQLLNAGCRITSIQRFLGHKKLNTTMIYARVHDQSVVDDYFAAMQRVEQRLDIIPAHIGDIAPTPKEEPQPACPDELSGNDEAVNVQAAGQVLFWLERLAQPELCQQERIEIAENLKQALCLNFVSQLSPPVMALAA